MEKGVEIITKDRAALSIGDEYYRIEGKCIAWGKIVYEKYFESLFPKGSIVFASYNAAEEHVASL